MSTSTVNGYDAVGDASYEVFTNPLLCLAEGGGSASVQLAGGKDTTSEVLNVSINSSDFLLACPGLTASSQITELLIRTRLSTTNGGGTLSAGLNAVMAGFPSFSGGGFAYVDVDVTEQKADLDSTIFAASDIFMSVQLTSIPPIGDNVISIDAIVLQVTYTVGDDGDDVITSDIILHGEESWL